jgi:hypothetical protein
MFLAPADSRDWIAKPLMEEAIVGFFLMLAKCTR